jgi:hypothetical protein
MNPKQLLDELSKRLNDLKNKSPAIDFEKNARLLLDQAFIKLNLVTREEFEVQTRVLETTRAKLDLLEKKLQESKKD